MRPFRSRLDSSAAFCRDMPADAVPYRDGEQLLLWAVRVWVMAKREAGDVTPGLRAAFEAHGAGEAFVALRELLTIAWRSASRPLNVAAPGIARPSPDERRLLAAIRYAQGGDLDACRRSLAALLCPLGARSAVLPAWGLARALSGLQASTMDGELHRSLIGLAPMR